MSNEIYDRRAPAFLQLPEQGFGRLERPAFMPKVEDLELNQGQIDRASHILIGLVKSHMHLEVASSFDIKFYTGGNVEIKYKNGKPGLSINREGMFELGVVDTRDRPDEYSQIEGSHIYFRDRVGEIRDSRNTLFSIDRMLSWGLTFTGHDKPTSFLDSLRKSVYYDPIKAEEAA